MSSPLYFQPLVNYLEAHHYHCRTECSYKLSPNTLEQERFVFELTKTEISLTALKEFAREFRAPKDYLSQFDSLYDDANAILLGVVQETNGIIYKIYFEFWDKIVEYVKKTSIVHIKKEGQDTSPQYEPQYLHIGFKWYAEQNKHCAVDHYLCHPLLSTNDILSRVSKNLSFEAGIENPLYEGITHLVSFANQKATENGFIYTTIDKKTENNRDSFIINLNRAEIRMGESKELLTSIHKAISNNKNYLHSLDLLLDQHKTAWLGNIASGLDRKGEPFFTVYFMYA